MADLGVVVRGDDGDLKVIAAKRIHATNPAMAEASAVHFGITLARRLGYGRVEIESDALAATMNLLKNKAKGSSSYVLSY